MSKKFTSGFTRTPKFGVSLRGKRGFSLIELLVVIAIIGILSSIVLASVNTARDKAANAAVKSNLKTTGNQMALYNDNNSTYVGACADPIVVPGLDGASMAGTGATGNYECTEDPLSWAAQVPLKVPDSDGSTFWCVDSVGASKGETVLLGASLSCA